MWNAVYWMLFILAIGAFYVGLRTEAYQIHYTVIALGFWGAAYWVNKKMIKGRKED